MTHHKSNLQCRAKVLVAVLTTASAIACRPGAASGQTAADRNQALQKVRRFAYQLEKLDLNGAGKSAADLLIIDPDGNGERYTPAQIAKLKQRSDGPPRVVLAHLCIGEAEDCREYWNDAWRKKPPAWLGPADPDRKGDFQVRYWQAGWQSLILGHPDAPLDQIIADGYDGVLLDEVEAFDYWEEHKERNAKAQMVTWVRRIAEHARRTRPNFLLVPLNGEMLEPESGFSGLIDGIVTEELFFENDVAHQRADTVDAVRHLKKLKSSGKPIFVVEYCRKPINIAATLRLSRELGFIPLVTTDNLDEFHVTPP